MTAVTGNVFTAAQFNQYVRDNLNVTEAAVASTAGNLLATTAANVLIERSPQVGYTGTFEATTNTSFVDLATTGPAVTVTSGTKCLVFLGAQVSNSNAGLGSRVSAAVSGATTAAAADANSYYAESGNVNDGFQGTWCAIFTVTAGSNTFTLKYRTTAGGGTSTFGHRLIAVTPF